MKKINILIYVYITLLICSFTLPVKNIKVTSTFGESRSDHFHNGVDFGGGEQDIVTIQDGKTIFYSDKNDFPFSQYLGSGNYIIIQHKDNLRSYYMHLKDGSINKTNYIIKEGSYIGRSSDTGHSYGIHLHFSIEKMRPLEILNPLKFFKNQVTDKSKPYIDTIFVKVDNNELTPVFGTLILKTGNQISILAKCYDMLNTSKVNPYKITCFLNNEKFTEYTFDKFIVKNNFYYSPPNYSFSDIYFKNDIYNLGNFVIKEKKYDIVIIVEDFFGHQTKTERVLMINK